MFFFIIFLATPSTTTDKSRHSNDKNKPSEDGDDDDDSDDDSDDDDLMDDDKYATARNEIDRGENDVERFARPEEANQICTYLMQTGQTSSANPSKKSSGVVLGGSLIKSDTDLSANFGN